MAIADELRSARLALGLTQAGVARALNVSRDRVSRIELRRTKTVSASYLARHSSVVGLRLSIKLYPVGGHLRDEAQARYIARFLERVAHSWRVRLDVPMPLSGDLRAVDVLLDGSCRIAVEIVTRLTDLQATLRSSQLKQRDIKAERLVIVVAATHRNRRALADGRASLLATFDLDTQRTLAQLAAGKDPGRDAIVLLSLDR